MSIEDDGHVSIQRAYQAVIESLSAMQSEQDEPSSLNEALLKRLLEVSFAHQFEDDTVMLEQSVNEVIDTHVDKTMKKSSQP